MPPDTPGPLDLNPAAAIQTLKSGGLFAANAKSGLMGKAPGLAGTYDLTFPDAGDYLYVCLVHGWMMSGTIHEVARDVAIPSPQQSLAKARQEIAAGLAKVGKVTQDARKAIQPPVKNANGTTTYKINMGFSEGSIDLMQFFPAKLTVRPGDTVVWHMPPGGDAPHTVTFLNGTKPPEHFIPKVLSDGTVALYANPVLLGPAPVPPADLTRKGFTSSGLLQPIPGTNYSLTIGAMKPGLQPYICLLHDESAFLQS